MTKDLKIYYADKNTDGSGFGLAFEDEEGNEYFADCTFKSQYSNGYSKLSTKLDSEKEFSDEIREEVMKCVGHYLNTEIGLDLADGIPIQDYLSTNLNSDTPEEGEDPVVESVMQDLDSRSKVGIKKYGTTLADNNTDDFDQHLYEELLDACLYMKKRMLQKNQTIPPNEGAY